MSEKPKEEKSYYNGPFKRLVGFVDDTKDETPRDAFVVLVASLIADILTLPYELYRLITKY